MCFFISFAPATIWVVIGYFVLFSSTKAEGPVKSLGQALAIWAFAIAAFIVLAGAYLSLSGLCPIGAMMECAR